MQNYFNDTQEVLETTQRIIDNDILYNQTSLIENSKFFELNSYSSYEVANNLFVANDDDEYEEDTMQEPLEWWLVSKWLYDKLTGLGFVTLETEFGYYWGRTTSGQAIELDNVIQDVARSIHNEQRQAS